MRVVADTNTVISALLWNGAPRQILNLARDNIIELYTSMILLTELEDVLMRDKFIKRLNLIGFKPRELVLGYASLATIIRPVAIAPVIIADPEDDAVIACALASQAEFIVSGDRHLLELKNYQKIPIFSASEFIRHIS